MRGITKHDAALIRDLIETPGWALLVSRLEYLRHSERESLIHDASETVSSKRRGGILMLDTVLGLPHQLIVEGDMSPD